MIKSEDIDAIFIHDFKYTTDYLSEIDASEESLNPHSHNYHELFIMLEGNIVYTVNDTKYNLRPTELFIVPPKQLHTVARENTENTIVRGMTIHIEFEKSIPSEFSFLNKITPIKLSNTPEIITWIHTIIHHQSVFSPTEFQALLKTYMAQFLMLLYKFFCVSLNNDQALNHLTLHIIAFIEQHLTERINVKTLESALNFNESYISKTFKQDMNLSIMQYIKQRRMLLAEALIYGGEKPIQAMYKSGFTDYSNFFKEFVKTYGVSPKQVWLKYRKEAPQGKKNLTSLEKDKP